MPSAEALRDERERDRDRELDRSDRGGSKSKSSASSSSKSKDLSHVPCKFYKVGGCTAGSSCPFSHNLPEPGHKETCTWFVKGNCKFGHKCALAHVLPGQSMAMDRKNKKAAQLAANTGAAGSEKSGVKEQKPTKANGGKRESAAATGNRNSLLTGSTAPTRLLTTSTSSASRPPMSLLKTSTSPSAPAPPLASLGSFEDLENENIQLPTAPAQGKQGSQDNATASTATASDEASSSADADPDLKTKSPSPGPLPMSVPRSAVTPTQPKHDFGPIGSPPAAGSLSSQINANAVRNDITPGTSPRDINGISVVPDSPSKGQSFVPSSPFSAPGTQTTFMTGNSYNNNGVGGIASSLSALTIMGGRKGGWGNDAAGENGNGMSSSQRQVNGQNDVMKRGVGMSILRDSEDAVEDGDMEDFLPSSLTDLLTPEERQRRMSRSHSGQTPNTAAPVGHLIRDHTTVNSSGSGMGHRHSRSVPAPSLLGDLKSIWSDNPNGQGFPSSPGHHRATPSTSFSQRYDPMAHNAADEMGLSISVGSNSSGMMGLSPSNASAAFLSGFHSQYLNSKAKQAQAAQLGLGNIGRGVRGTSGPLYSGNTGTSLSNSGFGGGASNLSSSSGLHTHANNLTNTQQAYRPSPFDLTQQPHLYPQTARPIPSNLSNAAAKNNAGEDSHQSNHHLLSPSARALQSHAPGQSLPQGLAAGYSRIHALPPPPNLVSPSSAGLFGTPPAGSDVSIPSSGPYGQWKGAASPPNNGNNNSGGGGFDGMFSRLSYSAAAATGRSSQASGSSTPVPAGQVAGVGAGNLPPPGLARTGSGNKQSTGPLSPLNQPAAVSHEADELFYMEG